MYGGEAAWDCTEADGRAWLLRALYETNPDVGSCILWFFTQRCGECYLWAITVVHLPCVACVRLSGIGAVYRWPWSSESVIKGVFVEEVVTRYSLVNILLSR